MGQHRLVLSNSNMSVEQIRLALNELNLILADLQNSICNLRTEKEIENGKKMDKGTARSAV
jgi:hypothetical protein